MGKKLIIAEKPSVAQDIARVLHVTNKKKGYYENNDYIVTYAVGHLISLGYPNVQNSDWQKDGKWEETDLPMLPSTFKYVINSQTKDQFYIIQSLIHRNDVDELINAGDDGREGEYIQRLIYEQANNNKPVKRLRISSMDDVAILQGFQNLVPSSVMDKIYLAAKCRGESDWKIGMNFSELVCLKNNTYGFSVGRVQSPTVNMILLRNDEITNFVSTPFYQIKATFNDKDGYWGSYVDSDYKLFNFSDKQKANQFIQSIQGKSGTITEYKVERKHKERPFLYSLSDLQTDANKKYGYPVKEILQIAQSLYETHKIITYPRTNSRYLTSTMMNELPHLVQAIANKGISVAGELLNNGLTLDKHVIDNSRVTDHHAIITNRNYNKYDLTKLSTKEKNILDMIVNRMLIAFSPQYEYDLTTIITDIEGHLFKSTGEVPVVLGWKDTAKKLGITQKASPDSQVFHNLAKGNNSLIHKAERIDKKTNPPKQYTQGTLVDAMKKVGSEITDPTLKKALNSAEGIGTEATRADIIETIIQKGYIEVKNKELFVTDKGRTLIKIVPERLKNPIMSAEWESSFNEIEKGLKSASDFNKEIDEYIIKTIQTYQGITISNTQKGGNTTVLGKCPKCGGQYIVGRYGAYCENKCGFSLQKYRKKNLTEKQIKKLLKGETIIVNNLVSQSGKTYAMEITPTGNLTQSDYNGKTYYYLEFKENFANSK